MYFDYTVTGAVTLTVLVMLLFMIKGNSVFDPRKKRCNYWAVAAVIAVSASELTVSLTDGVRHFAAVGNAACFVMYGLVPVIPLLLLNVFSTDYSKAAPPIYIPAAINIVLCALSPFLGVIFSISPNNTYSHGTHYWFYIAACIWSTAFLYLCIYKSTKRNPAQSRPFYSMLLGFASAGTLVQLFLPNMHVAWICIAISLVFNYAFGCEFGDRHDTLTMLYNRREFEIQKQLLPEREKATIIMFDVDDFKKINDNHGHSYGDFCLNVIGTTINEIFSDCGMGFRIGGDEFCVISESTDDTDINEHMKAFVNSINAQRVRNSAFPMVSFGWEKFYSASGRSVDETVNNADTELYKYKRIHKELRNSENAL